MTLSERRKSAGLTQVEVAKKVGVNQGAVSYWESGTNFPALKYRKKLAKLYGCTVDELFPKQ